MNDLFKQYSNPKIYLGFRSQSFNIYENELNVVKSCDPKIVIEDVNGILDINQIFKENGLMNDYFISGPPIMIKTFKNALISKGVLAKQILTDDWE